MKWTGLNELREKFLHFFEEKNHLRHPSASLVPKDDGSLLLINSGMAPLKNYFLGMEKPPSKRMTTCQKCIRTPDIEQVGKTSRHGTYFEMLGNFSFGDYFKEDATKWAWEFFREELNIPEELIWITVYEDDDEAYEIWTNNRKVNPEHIVRLGKEDNFWEIGSGPCGPCSEIFIDRGEEYGCDAPECGIGKCECDRYMEVWNLVFTQFNSDGEGNYTPLEHPNIDTGMGLERIACIMQGVDNLFEVDTVQNIMKHVGTIADVVYGENEQTDISLRVVTDHIRSTVFMVGDGIIPANEGRGYVLRRLLRRAARHGRLMGVNDNFLYKVCDTVIAENKGQYPELEENAEYIRTIIKAEEERFSKTIEQGMDMFQQLLDKLDTETVRNPIITGEDAFRLYDTFGFPLDLTREIAEDHGVVVDEEGFLAHMKAQQDRARKAHQEAAGVGWEEDVLSELELTDKFVGYETLHKKTEISVIVRENHIVESVLEGQEALIHLPATPFYPEGGGQAGDSGYISLGNSRFVVLDTKKSPTGHTLHIGKMEKGTLRQGDEVEAVVDSVVREQTVRNHSATHLLHAALRYVLGDHVHQAGSYVDDTLTRFDFTHFHAVTQKELEEIEYWVNRQIINSIPVTTEYMPMDEARAKGALALFGDKYGDVVRVCSMGDASTELCGGTHVSNTSQIGLFKIMSETSVAAGVRRIEATTSLGILAAFNREKQVLDKIAGALKVNSPSELISRAVSVMEYANSLENKVEELEGKLASIRTQDAETNIESIGDIEFLALTVVGSIGPMQQRADQLKEQNPKIVGVFIAVEEDNATGLVFAGKDAVKSGIHAGKLIKDIAAIAGGNGGGRPDNAKGGLPEVTKVDEALMSAKGFVKDQLEL